MKTLKTINLSQKIEPDLSEKLISLARSRKVSKSRLVRQAIADLV
jgi:predicted transcriptional regulator